MFNPYGGDVAFLTGYASVRKRKSRHNSASYVSGVSLMLFSTGFGFWGLARTSPQFFKTKPLIAQNHPDSGSD